MLGSAVAAQAEPDFLPPPPQPKDITIRAEKGKTIEIPLQSSRSSNLQLKFILRSRPKLGDLGEIKLKNKTTAVVPYTVKEDAPTGTDVFKYALQAPNSAVSVPGTVRIMVVEPTAKLSFADQLEFPPTAVGDRSLRLLEIRNSGEGPGRADFEVPSPWAVMGATRVEVPPGETAKVRIAFAPEKVMDFTGTASVKIPGQETVRLTGKGIAPLAVTPEKVVLRDPDHPGSDRASISIRNDSQASRLVTIAAPPEVKAPDEITVPAGQSVDVPVEPATDLAKRDETPITLSSVGWEERIPVALFALPGDLEVSPGRIDFGEVRAGVTSKTGLLLRNTGGTALRVGSELPSGIRLTPPILGRRISPDESLEVDIEFLPPAEFESAEILFTTGQEEIRLPVIAKLRESAAASEPASQIRRATVGTPPAVERESQPPESRTGDPGDPNAPAISLIVAEPDRLVLAWKLPEPPPEDYFFEKRTIASGGTGQPSIEWEEVPNADILLQEGFARAELTNLPPGTVLPLRLVPTTLGGTRGDPSGIFRLSTPHPPQLRIPWLTIGLALAVLALCGSLVYRKFIAK